MLAPEVLLAGDAERARNIAQAWGWRGRMADSVVRGATSAGPIASDRFVAMLAAAADPLAFLQRNA